MKVITKKQEKLVDDMGDICEEIFKDIDFLYAKYDLLFVSMKVNEGLNYKHCVEYVQKRIAKAINRLQKIENNFHDHFGVIKLL